MKKPYIGGLVHPAFWPSIETHFPVGSVVQDESGGREWVKREDDCWHLSTDEETFRVLHPVLVRVVQVGKQRVSL